MGIQLLHDEPTYGSGRGRGSIDSSVSDDLINELIEATGQTDASDALLFLADNGVAVQLEQNTHWFGSRSAVKKIMVAVLGEYGFRPGWREVKGQPKSVLKMFVRILPPTSETVETDEESE